jgi:serine/threonine-protein kinase RsbT
VASSETLKPSPFPSADIAERRLRVQRESDVPHVVANARQYCLALGLSPLLAAHVATAASELAHNLWIYASGGGSISLRPVRTATRFGVELTAVDHGPGIADVHAALQDGFSTGAGMGCGLPGVQRLMDDFDIQSRLGEGTRVRCVKWAQVRA